MKRLRWLLLLAIMAALLVSFALPSSAKIRIPETEIFDVSKKLR